MSSIHRQNESQIYSYAEISTPFKTKGQMYDLPMGQIRYRTFQFRVLTFIFLGISILLGFYCVGLSRTSNNTVFAAQVSATGYVSRLGVLKEDYTVSPEWIKHFLSQYIHIWFEGKVTPNTLLHNQSFVESFSAPAVKQRFEQVIEKATLQKWDHPIKLGQFQMITPHTITANIHIPEQGNEGELIGYSTINGQFKIVFKPAQTSREVYENPFGLYIAETQLEDRGHNE